MFGLQAAVTPIWSLIWTLFGISTDTGTSSINFKIKLWILGLQIKWAMFKKYVSNLWIFMWTNLINTTISNTASILLKLASFGLSIIAGFLGMDIEARAIYQHLWEALSLDTVNWVSWIQKIEWKQIGINIIGDIANGIKDKAKAVIDAIVATANAAIRAANKVPGVNIGLIGGSDPNIQGVNTRTVTPTGYVPPRTVGGPKAAREAIRNQKSEPPKSTNVSIVYRGLGSAKEVAKAAEQGIQKANRRSGAPAFIR